MGLFDNRVAYKPFEYPWAHDMWDTQVRMFWTPDEVPLHDDVQDWNHKLSDNEKDLLTQIFRFFTQSDCDVSEGYNSQYLPVFTHHQEVAMMLNSFAFMETIHVEAYSRLIDTIGMPEEEYSKFMEYQAMVDKHNFLGKSDYPFALSQGPIYTDEGPGREDQLTICPDWIQALAKQIAVYSAFTEGLQLFSSFAILLNFTRHNKMKGMGQMIAWSVRDESLHVQGMIKLFNTIKEEFPYIWTKAFQEEIMQVAKDIVSLEDNFIDLAFQSGDLEGLTKSEVKQYIRYIADRRLNQLGLNGIYGAEHPLPWVDELVGTEFTNFFENRATSYAKAKLEGSWNDVWDKS